MYMLEKAVAACYNITCTCIIHVCMSIGTYVHTHVYILYNIPITIITYEKYQILFSTCHYKSHFQLYFYQQMIDRFFQKLRNLLLQISVSLVNFMHLAKSHLILKSQYARKFILQRYICRNEFSFIRIILNIWQKLTFLFQLFPKFRENII